MTAIRIEASGAGSGGARRTLCVCDRCGVLELPSVVRNKAIAVGASEWLDTLGDLVAEIVDDWHLTLGRVFADATEAFVAEATLADGTAAVLKLMLPTSSDA